MKNLPDEHENRHLRLCLALFSVGTVCTALAGCWMPRPAGHAGHDFSLGRTIILAVILLVPIAWLILVTNKRQREQGKQEKKQPVPHGSIICPYCSALIHQDVAYLGQLILCPHCQGQLKAPGVSQAEIEAKKREAGQGVAQAAMGCLWIVFGVIVFAFAGKIVGCFMQ